MRDELSRAYSTAKVIEWLDKEKYSREHWVVVAQQQLDLHQEDDQVLAGISEALVSFHLQYRDAVVKQGNLLSDVLTDFLDAVDWLEVARTRLDQLKEGSDS